MNPQRLGVAPERIQTVLVVDDDEHVRRVSAQMIQRLGYAIVAASNGLEALQAIESQQVDLILCDMRMPDYDGEWLLAQMRARDTGIPVVIVTGLGELAPSISLAPDVIGYLVKPFRRVDLESIVRTALFPPAA